MDFEKDYLSEYGWMRRSVAMNPNCPIHILEILARDNDWRVRWGVAMNPNCPSNILEILSHDPEYLMRYSVAEHANCPIDIKISFILQN